MLIPPPRRCPAADTGRGPAARLNPGFVCLLPIVALSCMVSACGAPAIQPENDLFREASLALEDESYATAIENYKKLLEEYPFSDKAEVASLNIAYAYRLKEEYGEAIAAFNDFERLYPVSPLLPFVSYTIGMCWLDQAKAGDRDATASGEALRQFRKVASEFPKTLYADLAVFREKEARENLSSHEIVVGDYYRQRKQMAAAAGRYRYVVAEYPTTENAGRAAARLQEMDIAAAAQAQEQDTKQKTELAAEGAVEKATDTADVDIDPKQVKVEEKSAEAIEAQIAKDEVVQERP